MRKFSKVLGMVLLFLLACSWFAGTAWAGGTPPGNQVQLIGNLLIPKDHTITGDAVAVVGHLRVDGTVQGDAVAVTGNVEINGTVMGDVVAVVGNVTLTQNARVFGDVTSVVGNVHREPGSQVLGQTTQVGGRLPIDLGSLENFRFQPGWLFGWYSWLFRFTTWLTGFALGALLLAAFPTQTEAMRQELDANLGKSVFTGMVVNVLAWVIIGMVAITLVGIPVALLGIVALKVAQLFGFVAVALFVGHKVMSGNGQNQSAYLLMALGVLLIGVARMVPFFGFLLGFAVAWAGLGAVYNTKFGSGKPWITPRPPQTPKGE